MLPALPPFLLFFNLFLWGYLPLLYTDIFLSSLYLSLVPLSFQRLHFYSFLIFSFLKSPLFLLIAFSRPLFFHSLLLCLFSFSLYRSSTLLEPVTFPFEFLIFPFISCILSFINFSFFIPFTFFLHIFLFLSFLCIILLFCLYFSSIFFLLFSFSLSTTFLFFLTTIFFLFASYLFLANLFTSLFSFSFFNLVVPFVRLFSSLPSCFWLNFPFFLFLSFDSIILIYF